MEEETLKLLGRLNGSGCDPGRFAMSAQCNRVAVEDGHTESVSVKLKKKAEAGRNYRGVERISQSAAGIASAQRARTAGAYMAGLATVRSRVSTSDAGKA